MQYYVLVLGAVVWIYFPELSDLLHSIWIDRVLCMCHKIVADFVTVVESRRRSVGEWYKCNGIVHSVEPGSPTSVLQDARGHFFFHVPHTTHIHIPTLRICRSFMYCLVEYSGWSPL